MAVGELGWTEHEFEREGRQYRKQVDWFLLEVTGDARLNADAEEGAFDCGWFRPKQALWLLSHGHETRLRTDC